MASALARRAARLFCFGFHGQSVSPELAALIERGARSVILFSRNVDEPAAVAELTATIRARSAEPISIAVDQEGGAVRRLRRGFSELPAFRVLGDRNDEQLARDVGRVVGRELSAVGIDWNLAPVLDVDTNPQNPVIGQRALSSNPEVVARLGVAFALGIQDANVAACAKHFPGHGDTELDSHRDLPRCDHGLERLSAVELVPFAAAADAGIASWMSAHVVYSALDAAYPATLSRVVLHELGRGRLGFEGLVVSDDLEMQAIVDHFGFEDAVVRGLQAGVDLFLVCHTTERMHAAIDAVIHAIERGRVGLEQLLSAEQRVASFTQRWADSARQRPSLACLRSAEHLAVLERLTRAGSVQTEHDPTETH